MSLLTPLRTRHEEREAQRDAAFLAAAEASMRVHEPVIRREPVLKTAPVKKPANPKVEALKRELAWVRKGGDDSMIWNQNHSAYIRMFKKSEGCVVGHVAYQRYGGAVSQLSGRQMMETAMEDLGITGFEARQLWTSWGAGTTYLLQQFIHKYSRP